MQTEDRSHQESNIVLFLLEGKGYQNATCQLNCSFVSFWLSQKTQKTTM